MKFIQVINNSIFQRQKLLYAISIVVIIIMHKPIEKLLSNTTVKYSLCYVDSVWYNDIIFGLIIVSTVVFVLNRFRLYNPSKNILILLIVITFIYSIYRFFYFVWDFTPFLFSSIIKYTDVLLFITVSNLLLLIPGKETKRKNGKNSFFDDEPIGKTKVDELGYTAYAELLASKVSSSYFDKSFAIGINGKWGLGKTSFIDLLKRKLNDDDIIEINFNPWNSNSPKAIIQDFFETIQEAIKPYHSSLSRLLISYSNKLVSLNDNTVT